MNNWSEWILIADAKNAYLGEIDDEDAACYELGLFDDESEEISPVYVGETCNLLQRISSYAEHGSHLWEIIDDHLDDGFDLYVRFKLFYTKENAQEYEMKMLRKYDYDWNIKNNSSAFVEEEEE